MSANRYLILPRIGFRYPPPTMRAPQRDPGRAGQHRASRRSAGLAASAHRFEIVDSIGSDGPKVAALDSAEVQQLRREEPDIRILPIRKYQRALRPLARVSRRALKRRGGAEVRVRVFVRERGTKRPLSGVTIIAIVDRASRAGVRRRTGMTGRATITVSGPAAFAQVFVYPPPGFWGYYGEHLALHDGHVFELEPIDLGHADFVRHCFAKRRPDAGRGVKIGIVDSGVARNHADLKLAGGWNCVAGEEGKDFGAVDGHGTHVAGIIAGARTGLAPKAEIFSYRVFPRDGGGADTVAIAKAISRAVADGCDLINLSLGGGQRDDALDEAIGDAFEHGCVCVAAAGNFHRSRVGYPAWTKRAIAVSAIGRIGTFPEFSVEAADVADPRSVLDPQVFVAAFSNIGREIDFAAPGVGIISTWNDGGYAVESGTSMACPVVTAVAAELLSRTPRLLGADRDTRRARGIQELLEKAARPAGFPQSFEGFGRPEC